MSDLPNPRKGEATITIDGDDYLLRFNFRNLVQLQKALKINGRQLFEAISNMDFDVLSTAIHEGIKAGMPQGERAPSLAKLQDRMSFPEIGGYITSVMEALQGGEFVDDAKKKLESKDEDEADL